jgi:hypothetical protein
MFRKFKIAPDIGGHKNRQNTAKAPNFFQKDFHSRKGARFIVKKTAFYFVNSEKFPNFAGAF